MITCLHDQLISKQKEQYQSRPISKLNDIISVMIYINNIKLNDTIPQYQTKAITDSISHDTISKQQYIVSRYNNHIVYLKSLYNLVTVLLQVCLVRA